MAKHTLILTVCPNQENLDVVTDVAEDDGVVGFGDRLRVFKTWHGGIAEREYHGAGVAIGSRASVPDDLLKLKWTVFGVNVGPTSSRTLLGPSTVVHGIGSAVKRERFPEFTVDITIIQETGTGINFIDQVMYYINYDKLELIQRQTVDRKDPIDH
uniref:Macro domain-containing protein n=1 Tax=Heterorhabditis bacteriophora TaxID=37862 RepID=A0A1I7XKS6_HETBA